MVCADSLYCSNNPFSYNLPAEACHTARCWLQQILIDASSNPKSAHAQAGSSSTNASCKVQWHMSEWTRFDVQLGCFRCFCMEMARSSDSINGGVIRLFTHRSWQRQTYNTTSSTSPDLGLYKPLLNITVPSGLALLLQCSSTYRVVTSQLSQPSFVMNARNCATNNILLPLASCFLTTLNLLTLLLQRLISVALQPSEDLARDVFGPSERRLRIQLHGLRVASTAC